jgi:abequosyltransferase
MEKVLMPCSDLHHHSPSGDSTGEDMDNTRTAFSICIPAYNRARHLKPLLDSIFAQDFKDFEVIICEDLSPERNEIAAIVRAYGDLFPGVIRYYENTVNLGYDANIRHLIEMANGRYCFFMGNDDIMCQGALGQVDELIQRHPNVGFVLKSYAVFDSTPDDISQELRYFEEEREFNPGRQSIVVCYRRSGVISGYIIHRDDAQACATDQFDGTLYYQMHLTASVLLGKSAVFSPKILVLCRNSEPPDFGNSDKEKGIFTPGHYTPQARLRMVQGALSIVTALKTDFGEDLVDDIKRDYANYFYPFIRDQLSHSFKVYFGLYLEYWKIGFWKYPLFHVYCIGCYLLGVKRVDRITRTVRNRLGRTVQIGVTSK